MVKGDLVALVKIAPQMVFSGGNQSENACQTGEMRVRNRAADSVRAGLVGA